VASPLCALGAHVRAVLNLNLEYHPQSAATWSTIAFAQALGKRDATAALESLEKAVALEPQNPQLQELLAAFKTRATTGGQ
jgi:cytochrome c-type biogenesis protein CcmH/NrfG